MPDLRSAGIPCAALLARVTLCAALAVAVSATEGAAEAAHAIAMHGTPAMPDDFVG